MPSVITFKQSAKIEFKKNRLDPIGKMKVSDNTLDKINEKLKRIIPFLIS